MVPWCNIKQLVMFKLIVYNHIGFLIVLEHKKLNIILASYFLISKYTCWVKLDLRDSISNKNYKKINNIFENHIYDCRNHKRELKLCNDLNYFIWGLILKIIKKDLGGFLLKIS